MQREAWVEEIRQANPVGFGDEPQQSAIDIKAPQSRRLNDLQSRLAVAVGQFITQAARSIFVGQFNRDPAVPLHIRHCRHSIWQSALDLGSARQFFETSHMYLPPCSKHPPRRPLISCDGASNPQAMAVALRSPF